VDDAGEATTCLANGLIQIVHSEALATPSVGDLAGKLYVFLNEEGKIINVGDGPGDGWRIASVNGNIITVFCAETNTPAAPSAAEIEEAEENAAEVFNLYMSQKHAPNKIKDAADNYLLDPLWNNQLCPDETIRFCCVVAVLPCEDLPVISWARTFRCEEEDYYKYIWVKISESVERALPGVEIKSEEGLCMAFEVVLNFEDNDSFAAWQTLTPYAVDIVSGDELLIKVPHLGMEGTDDDVLDTEDGHDPDDEQTGARPVQLTYLDRSDMEGFDFFQDLDENPLAGGTVPITWFPILGGPDLNQDRVADPQVVEVWGKLTNFDFQDDPNGGAQLYAFEAYEYVDVVRLWELSVSFEYGPLSKNTKGAFGITYANSATDQCHQNGSYITLAWKDSLEGCNDDACDNGINYAEPIDGMRISDIVAAGYFYLHTDIAASSGSSDWDQAFGDTGDQQGDSGGGIQSGEASGNPAKLVSHGFNMGISMDPTPQGEHDSVFYVKVPVADRADRAFRISGLYGLTGNVQYSETITNRWQFWSGGECISDLVSPSCCAEPVGWAFIDFDSFDMQEDEVEYKILAHDALGAFMSSFKNPTASELAIMSRIVDRKVVLVLREVFEQACTFDDPQNPLIGWDTAYPEEQSDIWTLLNGITDDVDINYYFYTKDGDTRADFDRTTIFKYPVTCGWNLLPMVVDKVYYTGKSAPTTNKNYPDGITPRLTAKILVGDINEALIGLQEIYCWDCPDVEDVIYRPFIGSPQDLIFGLDSAGVAFGAAKDIQYLKAGYAYGIMSAGDYGDCSAPCDYVECPECCDDAYEVGSVAYYTFGYTIDDDELTWYLNGVRQSPDGANYLPGGKLVANVINIDDPKATRSDRNLGWNLITDVADIDLETLSFVDYVIAFSDGCFESWIKEASEELDDFDELTNEYNSSDDQESGKGYFVHTGLGLPTDR
jgi:hypothetical protein